MSAAGRSLADPTSRGFAEPEQPGHLGRGVGQRRLLSQPLGRDSRSTLCHALPTC